MTAQFDWYESRKSGLGHEFLAQLREIFGHLQEHPERHAVLYRGVRRVLVRRFPFKVFYLIDDETVDVLGVVHVRRPPEYWQRRAS